MQRAIAALVVVVVVAVAIGAAAEDHRTGTGDVESTATGSSTSRVDKAYVVGTNNGVETTRYGDNLPMTIYYPSDASGPFPVVIFFHGRKFSGWTRGTYRLSKYHIFVRLLNDEGYAVAVPVRSGYHSAPGWDGERIPCDNPSGSDVRRAIVSARKDVLAAIDKVISLPRVNTGEVFVAGTSAGGFASVGSMSYYPPNVKGVLSFGGSRCGKRGKISPAAKHVANIFSKAAKNSTIPVALFSNRYDYVIPPETTRYLFEAVCEARGDKCNETVFLVEISLGYHNLSSVVNSAKHEILQFLRDRRF